VILIKAYIVQALFAKDIFTGSGTTQIIEFGFRLINRPGEMLGMFSPVESIGLRYMNQIGRSRSNDE
jgi:hypothetical protein